MTALDDLRQALGPAVLTGDAIGPRHASDMSRIGGTLPLALVRPRTVEEVSQVLRICHAHAQPAVIQGGMTGLAGGGNPSGNDIALSLDLLSGIEEIDMASATMTVKAGTPLETCQKAATDAGLYLALDLGSRGTCQIGGNLSTNAGGNRVIRYGMAREQVLGIEAVLADGTVVSNLNKMLKNNAGYDLKQMFIGSEGTLGVITRAVLRLHPPAGGIATALCALLTYDGAVTLLRRAQSELGGVAAFEALWRDYHRFSAGALDASFFESDHPFWAIIETTRGREALETFLASCLEDGLLADAVIAQSEREARAMWAAREGLAVDTLPNIVNFDVSLPIASIGPFTEDCGQILKARWPQAHVFFYGHIGDSNLHITTSVVYGPGEDMHSVDAIVYALVRRFEGSISAEHGIGVLKRPYLHLTRNPEELALMRTLKQALDPKGILNPGKVI